MASEYRSEAGLDRGGAVVGGRIVVARHHPVGSAAVARVGMGERSHEGELVRSSSDALDSASQLHARKFGVDGPGDGAELLGGGRLGVDRLDVGRAAGQPQPDNGRWPGGCSGTAGLGSGAKQSGEGQGAEAQSADTEKVAAR